MKKKVALITGVTGQDGSYLARFLLKKNYKVHGLVRRASNINTERIEHIFHNPNLKLHYGDMTDGSCLYMCLSNIKSLYPNMTVLEIYNLAAQSHVKISFEMPEYTADTDGFGTLKLLEAIRSNGLCSIARFYQASTSELYGLVQETPQSETTPFYPRSPYGVAKLYAFWIVKNYREAYGMYACNGILFNHESERRGHNFVTRKVTLGLGKIIKGETDRLILGNIDSLRDWGHAEDYVEGMWRILQQQQPTPISPTSIPSKTSEGVAQTGALANSCIMQPWMPEDFVLATGKMHTVREFIEKAFGLRGFRIKWRGEGVNEIGYDEITGRELIFIDAKYFRPTEVELLLGNAQKAKTLLGWETRIDFDKLVERMVNADCV